MTDSQVATKKLTGAPVKQALLIWGIVLIAANLRAPITGIGPLLEAIRHSFSMSAAEAGLLTTLPLIAFAVVSPIAATLGRRFGIERTLFASLLLLTSGILLRSSGATWALFTGTAMIGSAIAIGNVLFPGLLKRDFPNKIPTMTAVYMLAMSIPAAAYSAAVVPLADLSTSGWAFALGIWVVIAGLAVVMWLPQLRTGAPQPEREQPNAPRGKPLWRSPLAWQVSLFMGINSLAYFIVVAWLPAILQDSGYSPAATGPLHGLLQLATVVPALVALPVMHRLKDQRGAAFLSSMLSAGAFIGLIVLPGWGALWIILYGLGTGAGLVLALSFIGMRAGSVQQAAALSGMAQAFGYLLAAIGPTVVGALHDQFGGWSAALLLCAVASAIQGVLGLYAGRAIQIGAPAAAR